MANHPIRTVLVVAALVVVGPVAVGIGQSAGVGSRSDEPVREVTTRALEAATLDTATLDTLRDALLVERSRDQRTRDLLLRRWYNLHVDLVGEALSADDIADRLRAAVGTEVNVVVERGDRDEAWPELEIDVRERGVPSMMAVISSVTDVAFVYRSSCLVLKPAGDVKEFKVLRTYDVSAATFEVVNRPGPQLGLRSGDDFTVALPDDEEEPRPAVMDIERLEELLRDHVAPEAWGTDGHSISKLNQVLCVRTTERNHREVARLLTTLGAWSAPQIVERRAPVPVPVRRVVPVVEDDSPIIPTCRR